MVKKWLQKGLEYIVSPHDVHYFVVNTIVGCSGSNMYFFFFEEPEILLGEKANYTWKLASPWITETKEGGPLLKSKEPKKLQAKDYFAREWEATLHNLGTQQIETLGEDVKRTRESAQIDLIL